MIDLTDPVKSLRTGLGGSIPADEAKKPKLHSRLKPDSGKMRPTPPRPKPSVDLDSSSDDIKVIEIVSTSTSTPNTTRTVTSTPVPTTYTSTPALPKPWVSELKIPKSEPSFTKSEPISTKSETLPTKYEPMAPKSEPMPLSGSFTPKCLFVRPFEDDYSPIARPDSRPSSIPSSLVSPSVKFEAKVEAMEVSKVEVIEVGGGKVEDQDSDYESMSSDSSIKRESLCESLNKGRHK